jgi:hypothetical protein
LSEAGNTLISLLLPEGILDYFDLINVEKDSTGLNIYLEEKNLAPDGYQKLELESKGFFLNLVFKISQFVDRKWPYALKDADGPCSVQEK